MTTTVGKTNPYPSAILSCHGGFHRQWSDVEFIFLTLIGKSLKVSLNCNYTVGSLTSRLNRVICFVAGHVLRFERPTEGVLSYV